MITKEYKIFKVKSENVKIVPGSNPFDLRDCVYDTLECKCGLVVGAYMKSASKEFNGCSGAFLFLSSITHVYKLGSTLIEMRTMGDIEEDIEKIKHVIEKMYTEKENNERKDV